MQIDRTTILEALTVEGRQGLLSLYQSDFFDSILRLMQHQVGVAVVGGARLSDEDFAVIHAQFSLISTLEQVAQDLSTPQEKDDDDE